MTFAQQPQRNKNAKFRIIERIEKHTNMKAIIKKKTQISAIGIFFIKMNPLTRKK